jgi:NAD(P)-dependent dehydrogenase (short-subunit alcohol dehydrogenase family)
MNGETLKGQIALVTGAASGIGAGVAGMLGAAGASVAINYVTDPDERIHRNQGRDGAPGRTARLSTRHHRP